MHSACKAGSGNWRHPLQTALHYTEREEPEDMKIDPDCRYNQEHEWIRAEGDEGVVGISDYAQDQLSDVVYVELPEVGDTFEQGDMFAVVESVKAASDVYMPVSGEILEINEKLEDSPELVNQDPYGEAWFVRITITDPAELDGLMDAGEYEAFLKELDE
jgi:glycine cleavage system H protein